MLWLFTNALVWLFYAFVAVVIGSLFVEVVEPGKYETLHHIYKVILEFDEEES